MNEKFKKPKGFGEILDLTFQLSKNRFRDFFMILVIFMGPVYLIEAVLQLFSGTSFFREVGSGSVWFEQMLSSFEQDNSINTGGLSSDLGLIIVGLISLLLFPIAEAAVLLLVDHVRKNEEYSVGKLIKQAFSRFWPILGSNLLFGLIIFGLILIPIGIFVTLFVVGEVVNPILVILIGIVVFLCLAVGIGLLATRWSFYFASVVLDKVSPGIGRSWRLSRKQTWKLLGLYIVFYLIISTISFAIQITFGLFLGNSVLLSMISNIATLFTTMVFSVGYAVMYLDLKIRNEADDLKEMIDDYKIND